MAEEREEWEGWGDRMQNAECRRQSKRQKRECRM